MSKTEAHVIGADAAHHLAPLIAAYAQEQRRGAPRRPDEYYAELLLEDRTAELIGGYFDGELVGFAVFFDLPEPITGLRCGQLDDVFVIQDKRRAGVAKAMLDALITEGETRGWSELRWLVAQKNDAAKAFYKRYAEPADWQSYVINIERDGDG